MPIALTSPLAPQLVERLGGAVHGGGVHLRLDLGAVGEGVDVVDVEDVDVVEAEPLQAVLVGAHDAVIGIVEIGLERQRLAPGVVGLLRSPGAAAAAARPWSTASSRRAGAAHRRPAARSGRSRRRARCRNSGRRNRRPRARGSSASESVRCARLPPSVAPPRPSVGHFERMSGRAAGFRISCAFPSVFFLARIGRRLIHEHRAARALGGDRARMQDARGRRAAGDRA